MTEKELKWYVVSKIGSKINKTIIKSDNRVYKTLQLELQTDNIDCILNYLIEIGFVDNRKSTSKQVVKEVAKEGLKQTIPSVEKSPVKTYYIEPQIFEKPNDDVKKYSILKGYLISKSLNKENNYKQTYNEKYRGKVKNGLSKPYYRENTNYNSIW